MRIAVATLALLAMVSTRHGCGGGGNGYDPCGGKACGDACHICAPGDPGCVETEVAKVCDGVGRCVAPKAEAVWCSPPDPCAGKTCGASCVWEPPCRNAIPPCMAPTYLGHCSADGACIPQSFAGCAPDPACAGKVCGDACDACGSGCMNPVATACDYAGRCTPWTAWLCYDPCALKTCGEKCLLCPPDALDCGETAVLKACDAAGVCTSALPVTCP